MPRFRLYCSNVKYHAGSAISHLAPLVKHNIEFDSWTLSFRSWDLSHPHARENREEFYNKILIIFNRELEHFFIDRSIKIFDLGLRVFKGKKPHFYEFFSDIRMK